MSAMTSVLNSAKKRPDAISVRPAVPWLTVVPLAVLMAYGDGFWITSLRGAAGAIERTQGPFESWLRESTLVLPIFVLAVLGALTLALRWLGPVLFRRGAVAATALMIVAAGTVVGVAEVAASSAYDYHLQSEQVKMMDSMRNACAGRSCAAEQRQASLALQVRAVGYGSGILLLTNFVLVGWGMAIRGGRLEVSATRKHAGRTPPQRDPAGRQHHEPGPEGVAAVSLRSHTLDSSAAAPRAADIGHVRRVADLRLYLAAALFGTASIHAAVVPQHLSEWGAAGAFFIALAVAELVVAGLLLARPQPILLLAAAVVSISPLVLWLYSRTAGMPFGPGAGAPEPVGSADGASSALELGTLLIAVVLLRGRGWLSRRPPSSAHVRWLILVAVIAVTAIGLAGSGLAWFDAFGVTGDQPVMSAPH